MMYYGHIHLHQCFWRQYQNKDCYHHLLLCNQDNEFANIRVPNHILQQNFLRMIHINN